MTYNYCTLFNSNYLSRGLAMYESLSRHSQNFHLFIYPFDEACIKILRALNLPNITLVSLEDFESEVLLKVKKQRSEAEYCWTCTPSIIHDSIERFTLDHCTYLDADLYFFSDPEILIEEMGEKSVLITKHNYTPRYDQSATSGIYCVQFMTFKNNQEGIKVLNWWREACLDWCYARHENGKFGDQKYLDDWPARFEGVHVLKHKGGGVAPWNIQQFDLQAPSFNMIFYHFHGLKFVEQGKVDLGSYELSKLVIETVYKPYIKHLAALKERLSDHEMELNIDIHGTIEAAKGGIYYLKKTRRILSGVHNIVNVNQ